MNTIVYAGRHTLTRAVSRHTHNSWELIYCTGGSGELLFEGRPLPYGANDVAVIPPLAPHANMSREGFTNIHVNLADAAFPDPEPIIIRGDPNGFLADAFSAAFYYWSEPSAGHALLPVYGQLIAALVAACRPGPRRSEVVQRVEDHILHHYPDCAYDLNAYLSSLPFSTEYVKKLFKKETGRTPLQYLTEKRLENAASTLATFCGWGSVSETACAALPIPCTFPACSKRNTAYPPETTWQGPPAEPAQAGPPAGRGQGGKPALPSSLPALPSTGARFFLRAGYIIPGGGPVVHGENPPVHVQNGEARPRPRKKDPPRQRRVLPHVSAYASVWATTLVARTPLAPRGSGSVSKVTFCPSSSFL